MKKIIIVLLIVTLGVIGNYYYKKQKNKSPQTSNQVTQQQSQSEQKTEPPAETQSNIKIYTMDEVAKHGVDFDIDPELFTCWVVLHGKVYDVTKFVDDHPGGESIYTACGTDGTNLFETRPMGTGTPHSSNARSILEKYYIGDLKK